MYILNEIKAKERSWWPCSSAGRRQEGREEGGKNVTISNLFELGIFLWNSFQLLKDDV